MDRQNTAIRYMVFFSSFIMHIAYILRIRSRRKRRGRRRRKRGRRRR